MSGTSPRRAGWPGRRVSGYGRHSLVETTIGRYKHIIGPMLRARSPDCQQGGVAMAVYTVNRMIRIAKPISVRSSSLDLSVAQPNHRPIHATTPPIITNGAFTFWLTRMPPVELAFCPTHSRPSVRATSRKLRNIKRRTKR